MFLRTGAFFSSILSEFLKNLVALQLGITPIQYVKQYRVEKAAELLRSTRLKTGEIGAECGFTDGSYFIKIFREIKHCTPKEYRMKFC